MFWPVEQSCFDAGWIQLQHKPLPNFYIHPPVSGWPAAGLYFSKANQLDQFWGDIAHHPGPGRLNGCGCGGLMIWDGWARNGWMMAEKSVKFDCRRS